jgi:copper resistance protein D
VTPDQALILCRFVVDGCALLLWGAHAYLWVGVSAPLAKRLHHKLRFITTSAVLLLAIAAACKIPLQAAILGNGWGDAANPSLIHDLITDTHTGLALAVQMVLGLMLAATYFALPARRISSLTGLAGLILASLTMSGHAAMNSGMFGLLHQANDGLHVLAVSAWVGALLPVFLLLKIKPDQGDWDASMSALMRFSTLGHGAVALTILTGIINSWMILGQVWLDLAVPYQRLLLLKIAVVAVMVSLACINRYVFVPRMAQNRSQALQLLRLGTVLEIGLGILAIALVAIFGVMEPS